MASLQADAYSDWDFHLVTSQPRVLHDRAWMAAAGLPAPALYTVRGGRLGAAAKANAIVAGQLVDVVIMPAGPMRLLRFAVATGLVRRSPRLWHALLGLATVAKDGHVVLKGGPPWERFYARLAQGTPTLRLDDAAACALADGFVCDYVSTRQKLARGELLAAQRWLHVQLGEVNFQLRHELRQRQGSPSMPDARRVERLADEETVRALRIEATVTAAGLSAALEHAAATLRTTMHALVGDRWSWPDVPGIRPAGTPPTQ
jgi:hypothetical protein